MLAISSWTWIAVAAMGLLSLGVLIRVTIGLIGRIKELNRTLRGASGQLRDSLDAMRADLDRTNDALADLRRHRAPGR